MSVLAGLALKGALFGAAGYCAAVGAWLLLDQPPRRRSGNPFARPAPDNGARHMAGAALIILAILTIAALAVGDGVL